MKTHGMKGTKIYNIWRGMRDRTRRKSHPHYKNYGGRGIKVCKEWESFETFYTWAISHGYKEGLSIDRLDNDGDYCPENCKFSTREEQANNKRNNHIITVDGESHNIEQWAKILGVKRSAIAQRIKRKWSDKDVITRPFRKSPTRGQS
jgi:hypothetical protein